MFFYPLLLIFIVFSSLCVTYGKEKHLVFINKIITFNLLFIPAAIRYGIGADYYEYVTIFNHYVSKGVHDGHTEIAYWWLNRIVYMLGGEVQWVFAIMAFLTLFFIFVEIEKNDWIVYAPITMIIVYSWMYTEIRQVLAMSMIFASIKYWNKKKEKNKCTIIYSEFLFS